MVENVERHLHDGKRPFQAAIEAARELVGPIIAMTITLGGGIRAGRHPGRTHRDAVPRIRLHAGGRSHRLGRGGADAVADDGIAAAPRRRLRTRLLPVGSTGASMRVRSLYTRMLTCTLRYRPVVLVLWAIVAMLIVPFYMFSQQELAPAEDQGVVFGVVQAAANSTIDQTTSVFEADPRRLSLVSGERRASFRSRRQAADSAAW